MSDSLWSRARDLFDAAAGLPAAERGTFLDRACEGDEELRGEVCSLLAAGETELSLLDGPLIEAPRHLLDESGAGEADLAEGGRLGPYQLLGELGRGGMSTVYLAERDDGQYRRRVAIKVIRRDLGDAETLRRFRQERQILASLDHPNIARLIEGGSTPEGWPYVVMEAVDGLSIDLYCRRQGLSLRARLALFQRVCHAVHYAHQNLVVHRDLKPSNVLVTAEGTPKLLDFGIAKLLNPELSPRELVSTLPSLRPMTPAYASPEQVRGEPVTTATDIYALGVLLYELLAGESPHRFESRHPREIERAICERKPPPPSRAGGAAASGIEARRLGGDLDAIVLQALAKEPRLRYGSAEQLAEDLGRHLSHRPVRARRPTPAYRLWKLVRRNRLSAALAAAVTLCAAVMSLQTLRLGRALAQVRAEKAAALHERSLSNEVTAFLLELFEGADPHEVPGEELRAREILERGARRVGLELTTQPRTQAALLDTIGRAYQNLGLYRPAGQHLEHALQLRRGIHGEEHPEVAESLAHLAFLRHVESDLQGAETLGRKALELRRRLHGERHRDVAASLHDLAEVLATRRRYEEAEDLYLRALELRRELLGPRHADVAESLDELGLLYAYRGSSEEAEALLREAVEIWRERLGPEHPTVAHGLSHLAHALEVGGDHAAAEELLEQALSMQRRALGESHPDVVENLAFLGTIYYEQGRLEEAERALRRALEIQERGGEDLGLGTSLNDLGQVYRAQGEFTVAEEQYQRALAVYRRSLGNDHPAVAVVLANLARNHRQRGDLAAAEERFREVLALRRRLGPANVEHALALLELGRLLNQRGSTAEAEPLLEESRSLLVAAGASEWAAVAGGELARSLEEHGQTAEAEALLGESHAVLAAAGETWRAFAEKVAERLSEKHQGPTVALDE